MRVNELYRTRSSNSDELARSIRSLRAGSSYRELARRYAPCADSKDWLAGKTPPAVSP
jgi:hypothetical protein